MNSKKVLLICIILIIAISSLSIASAGLFDNNDNNSDNQDKTRIQAEITDSQLNYELKEVKIMKPGNNSFEQTGNYSEVKYNGYITVNLTGSNGDNLSDDEIKTLKDTLDNKSNKLWLSTSLFAFNMECDKWNYTLDNNILTITFDTTYKNPAHHDVNGSSSGTVNITQFELKNPSTSFYINGLYR